MKCPNCSDSTLVMTERQGVEIDYCPACRGVWLDRGELDKLLDRAPTAQAPTAYAGGQAPPSPRQPDFEDSDFRRRQPHQQGRKKSWLNDIFD